MLRRKGEKEKKRRKKGGKSYSRIGRDDEKREVGGLKIMLVKTTHASATREEKDCPRGCSDLLSFSEN